MNTIQPNDERAQRTILMLWISMAAIVIFAIFKVYQYYLIGNLKTGEATVEDLLANAQIEVLLSIIYMVILIVTGVFFIQWFRRAYNTLHILGIKNLSFSEGWAAGAWFVPILNWARPYTIMCEIWEETQDAVADRHNAPIESPMPILYWWGCWVSSSVLGVVASVLTSGQNATLDNIQLGLLLTIIAYVLYIPAGIFIIQIIRKMMVFERNLRNHPNLKPTQDLSDHLID